MCYWIVNKHNKPQCGLFKDNRTSSPRVMFIPPLLTSCFLLCTPVGRRKTDVAVTCIWCSEGHMFLDGFNSSKTPFNIQPRGLNTSLAPSFFFFLSCSVYLSAFSGEECNRRRRRRSSRERERAREDNEVDLVNSGISCKPHDILQLCGPYLFCIYFYTDLSVLP